MLVKICGLTSVDDAQAAAEAGADWIGLNFHPPSSRFVDEAVAQAIVRKLPPQTEPVALFVNRPASVVAEMAHRLGIGIVQLHGSEPVSDLPILKGLRVVRAFRIGDLASLFSMSEYVREAADSGYPLHAVLVDAFVPGQFGGTGHAIGDDLLGALRERLPDLPPMILAGGLTPENVADRASRVRPWMVDVAGGVESEPGRKHLGKIRSFVRQCRVDGTS